MTLPEPYYQDDSCTIYCGDCREILPLLRCEALITDPIWPNNVFPGVDAFHLLQQSLEAANVERVIIHLGCDSDPRFLAAVPKRWPFLRVCWMDYGRPSYKGRILYGSDVAYAFGPPPSVIPGRMLIPGKCMAQKTGMDIQSEIGAPSRLDGKMFTHGDGKERAHPCPRRIQHVKWLVANFSDSVVIDPFMGSGTTLVAAKYLGRKAIGIEIELKYCEIAKRRLAQEVFAL